MRKLILLARAFALLVATACPLAAQNNPCTQRNFLVTVIDREGEPVRGLAAADFRGKFRGQPVQIESAAWDTRPRRMVIVLDVSGSMMQERRMGEAVRSVAADAARQTRATFSLALVIFASEVLETKTFDEGYAPLGKRISDLQFQREVAPKGHIKTALYDALAAAHDLLTPSQPGDIIYAITDGGDNKSQNKASQIERSLTSQNIRFFCLLPQIYFGRGRTPEEATGPAFLERLTNSTGGGRWSLYPRNELYAFWSGEQDKAGVLHSLGRFYDQMQMTYRLKARLPLDPDKPREWDLDIVNAQGKRRGDLTVLYPRELLPCGQITPAPTAQGAPK